jgi:TolB-like protein
MTKFTQLNAVIALVSATIAPWCPPVAAQTGVALAGFETDGSVGLSRANYDAMGRAMTILLATEIGSHTGATVVAIRTPGGVRMGRIDVAKARAAAAQVGAKYLIVGTILDQYGDLRVEARLLNAASGDPVAVVRADKGHTKREDLVESATDLAIALGRHAELGGARKAPERGAISVEAMVSFGEGLRFEDEGDRGKAAESYRAALKLSPGLTEAAAALRRVGG